MRDTYLGLNQKSALKLRNEFMLNNGNSNIGIEDLILIRRIGDFIISSKTVTVIVDNECYHWVHYETIQNDLPLIFPSVLALKKRVEKLSKLNLLINKKYAVSRDNLVKGAFDKPGNYSVIKLSVRARELFDIPEKESIVNTENIEGFYPLGDKGCNPLGDKGCNPLGVNKEYQEINTKKNNTIHGEKKLELGIFENLFKELGIKFTAKNQASTEKLLSKMNTDEVIQYLKETYILLSLDKSIRNVGGVFSKKIANGERQIAHKTILDENSTLDMNKIETIDYRAFNRKQKIETMEKEINDIEKIELKEKIKTSLTEENNFLDLEALEKIISEDYEYVLIKRFNNKYLGGER